MPTGVSVIQEKSDGRRGHVLGAEESQGKLRKLQGLNVGVFLLSPHGDFTWNIPAIEQGVRGLQKSTRYISGVLSTYIEII